MEHVSNQDNLFIGKGRRKRAIARISLLPKPSESSESPYSCQINGQPLQSYFGNDPFSLLTVEGPLKLLAEQEHPFLDVEVKVRGGLRNRSGRVGSGRSSRAFSLARALSRSRCAPFFGSTSANLVW